jgi:enoyl-CoA hydratase/carnithine racemase
MPKYGAISLDIKDGIARVLVERPPVNAFSDALVAELNSVLTTVEESTDVSVLHFKSGLKVFSAGADLEQIQNNLSTAEGRDSIIASLRSAAIYASLRKKPSWDFPRRALDCYRRRAAHNG